MQPTDMTMTDMNTTDMNTTDMNTTDMKTDKGKPGGRHHDNVPDPLRKKPRAERVTPRIKR